MISSLQALRRTCLFFALSSLKSISSFPFVLQRFLAELSESMQLLLRERTGTRFGKKPFNCCLEMLCTLDFPETSL